MNLPEFNISQNPLLFTGLAATVGSFVWKYATGLPSKAWTKGKLAVTTTLTVSSSINYNEFGDVKDWLAEQKPVFRIRTFSVRNYRPIQGSGMYLYKFNGYYFLASWQRIEKDKSAAEEQLVFTFFGRSSKGIEDTLKDVLRLKNSKELTAFKYVTQSGNSGSYSFYKNKRSPSTVFHPAMKDLQDDIKSFMDQKSWYQNHGIPYRRGYLLYGPPGTGKTSLVHALASHFDIPVWVPSLPLGSGANFFLNGREMRIALLEDIDRQFIKNKRVKTATLLSKEEAEKEAEEMLFDPAVLLNTLDGLESPDNIIFILTANHPEVLPAALTRPGRIDKKIEIGYLDENYIRAYIKAFFPKGNERAETDLLPLAGKITGAKVQSYLVCLYFGTCDPQVILKEN